VALMTFRTSSDSDFGIEPAMDVRPRRYPCATTAGTSSA
jgi:hypothetical protein